MPAEAAASYEGVCRCRGFKALKQTVKLYFKLGNHEKMMGSYRCDSWSCSCET